MSLLDLEKPEYSWNIMPGLGSTFCLASLKAGDNSKDHSVIKGLESMPYSMIQRCQSIHPKYKERLQSLFIR